MLQNRSTHRCLVTLTIQHKGDDDMDIITGKYIWWIGSSEERFDTQYDTKEEAIEYGKEEYDWNEGFYICEAITPEIQLADFFVWDHWIEWATEQAWDDYGDPDGDADLFPITSDQAKQLEAAIKKTINEWQAENKLKFSAWQFSDSRNHEYIPVTVEGE